MNLPHSKLRKNRSPIIFLETSVFIFSYGCGCGKCSLERLRNAGECLCCHEMEKCVESDAVTFPGSRDNSTMRDNASRFQRRLSEPLDTALG